MNIRGTSVRKFVCFTSIALGPVLSAPPLLSTDAPRPIKSLTIQQRMNLPGNTQVKLRTRIVTLAVLREEHQTRMQRFANTEALVRAARSKMPPISPQTSSKTAQQQKQGGGTPQSGSGGKPAGPHSLDLEANPGFSMVPNTSMANSRVPLPRDYVAACTGSTACLYVPGHTYLIGVIGGIVSDIDPMLTDPGLCAKDGGWIDPDGACVFVYLMSLSENYQLARAQSTAANCDPPMKFKFDPANVIKIWYDAPPSNATSLVLEDNLTCAIQVWQWR